LYLLQSAYDPGVAMSPHVAGAAQAVPPVAAIQTNPVASF
jgi:hypothetical protein